MMPDEQKINLLKKYMEVDRLPICSSLVENNSDKNSTGSYDSDDGVNEKGKKKDKKGNSVSKQFGSFGKSVGKKLKNLGKGNKDEKKGSIGRNSQTSRIPLTISALADSDQQSIWCCKLAMKKSSTHQKMVDNYLYDAELRYKAEVAANRIKPRDNGPLVVQRVPCVTSGCSLYGTPDTSYLCSKCFADQTKVQIDHEDRLRGKHDHSGGKHDTTVDATKIGKSKFYDMNTAADSRSKDWETAGSRVSNTAVHSQAKAPHSSVPTQHKPPGPQANPFLAYQLIRS